jgi:hypothetical protein
MPTFDVYPQPQSAPKSLDTGLNKVWTQAVAERRSADAPFNFMYIRITMVGPTPGSAANYPAIQLQAGTGDPVTGPYNGSSPGSVYDQPGGINGPGTNVGDAYFIGPSANGVYFVKVLLYVATPSSWKVIITNNDVAPRDFVMVVASADGGADGGAEQPWISADTTPVNFSEVLVGDTGFLNLTIANKGTGDLTGITGTFSGPDAASFSFTPPVNPISPNGSDVGQVALLAVGTTKSLSATLKLTSNDTTVTGTPGHNSNAIISGQVEQLELAFLVDASGSMALDPDGHDTNISGNISLTRYGILLTAVEAALTALKNHAANKGNFGLTIYPNITGFPALPSAPYGGPFPVPSPTAADFQAGKALAITETNTASVAASLQQHFTRENGASTPMGMGIQAAMGDKAGTLPWGFFLNDDTSKNSNRRWLFLMTDGNHNSGPPDPPDFYSGAGSFVAKKIKVGAIGYGTETAITQPVNKTLLQTIAQKGYLADNLNFNFTEATGLPSDVNMFIKPLMYQGLNFDTGADPGGVLTSTNPVVTRQISITPYDEQLSFFVSWTTANAERLTVQVRTPLGELLEAQAAGYTVDSNPRFRMLTFPREYLANSKDPANPRFGVWTLILTLNQVILEIGRQPKAAAIDSEKYNYDVFLSSRLKLRPELSQKGYAPGDKIQISARLTLDGTGIPYASVTLSRVVPGAAHLNFLARSPLSAQEYSQAAEAAHANPDIDSTGIKLLGLAKKGLTFDPLSSTEVINMVDAGNTGAYVASTSNTSVPGTYSFLITAVGTLADGTFFRRERALDIQVSVQPDPQFTVFHVDYSVIVQREQKLTQAVMTVSPQDRFGNVIFIDPRVDPSIEFTTTAGTFPGAIVDNHDGTYSRTLVYAPTDHPVVGVIVGGTVAVPPTPVVTLTALHYIDKVFQFRQGREAAPGANKHTDPHACLGDFTTRPTPQFVSLGGGGSIVVGFKDHAMVGSGGGDVTIFIAADEEPRPYLVEATEDDDRDDWHEIGRSAGVTQSFGLLHHSRVIKARALRITDLSGRIRNNDGSPSASPGVSVVAVGALKVEEAHTDILEAIENIFKKIF